MKEKNVTKISLSTFFLILAIIAIIVMGIFIYKLNNDKTAEIQKSTELQSQVNNLNGTVSDLQGKINSISETINSNEINKNTVTDNTTITSSNESTSINQSAIESAIQKYFDIRQTLTSNTLDVFFVLGLKAEHLNGGEYEDGFYLDKPYAHSYFIKTDVSYTDFSQVIAKYMTIELFEKLYPNYIINKDGYVCIYSDGGTTGKNTLKECKISKIDSNTYICDVTSTQRWDDDGRTSTEKTSVTVIEKNGNYIVSDYK